MRVLLIGDVHGNFGELPEFVGRVRAHFRIGAAIQVGDFGFFQKGFSQLERARVRFAVPLHVIDGNHEEHAWLQEAQRSGASAKWRTEMNLCFQPRGSVLALGSSRVGFLGGALNVDQPQLQDRASGSSNYIRAEEVQQALAAFNREGLDLMVSHSCPTGIGIKIPVEKMFDQGVTDYIVARGFDPGDSEDCGDVQLRTLWEKLSPKPAAWVFGHFHKEHEARVGTTFFRCLKPFKGAQQLPVVLWETEERALVAVG